MFSAQLGRFLAAADTATEQSSNGFLDIIGTLMWPLRFAVESVLVAWHWLLTKLGMQTDGGWTWIFSIVGLVIVVRILVFPLFVKQIKSSRKMLEIAPELRKVQEKYRGKKDQLSREAMSRETMALYKKHGTTPMSSCFPMLIQMPIFLSLFYTLLDITKWHNLGTGGITGFAGILTSDLVDSFYDAKIFNVVSLHETLTGAWQTRPEGWQLTTIVLAVLVVLMIASQFITQLQIISKNMAPEAKVGQAYQMQKIMLYVLPLGFIFSGLFFPLGVVIYWFTSNLWTMAQQFFVLREMPTPGSDAWKAREARLAKKGKAINKAGKVVSQAEYDAEQQRLLEEAERARAEAPRRQQPKSKKRAKKQGGSGGAAGSNSAPGGNQKGDDK